MLGQRIQQVRKMKKISSAEMATAIGVSKRTLGYYEAGEREPGASACVAIAKLCSVSVEYILTGLCTSQLREGDGVSERETILALKELLVAKDEIIVMLKGQNNCWDKTQKGNGKISIDRFELDKNKNGNKPYQ